MPAVADQVATLEHDLASALVTIDSLKAQNSTLNQANTALMTENGELAAKAADMQQYVDSTRALVEQMASSALDMLRASRKAVGPIPSGAAVSGKPQTDVKALGLAVAPFTANHPEPVIEDGRLVGMKFEPPIGAPQTVMLEPEATPTAPADQDAVANSFAGDEQPDAMAHIRGNMIGGGGPSAAALAHIAGAPMFVEHDDNDLPIFLKATHLPFGPRGTVFG